MKRLSKMILLKSLVRQRRNSQATKGEQPDIRFRTLTAAKCLVRGVFSLSLDTARVLSEDKPSSEWTSNDF